MGQLHDAAAKGDVAAINTLLQKRGLFGGAAFDVNCRSGKHGHTPLHKAAKSGQVEAVRALVAAGADMGVKDIWWGMTPLHLAAYKGQVEAMRALVAAGADMGAENEDDFTPLHYAARNGQVEAVRALVAAGADMGAKATGFLGTGWTPLHMATYEGHVEAVRALVAAGADVGAKNGFGKTPLDLAKTDELRKALSAPPQRPSPVPPPPAGAPIAPVPQQRPTPPPAPASNAPALYTGGAVTLPSPLPAGKAQGLVAALAGIGLQAAVQVAGAVVTCNPVALVMAPVQLVQAVQALLEQGQYSRERLQRMVARVAALEPALAHLGQELRPPVSTGTPRNVVESLCRTLVLLAWVMVQLQEVQRRLQSKGEGALRRTLELLKAGGCEQEVAALDLELRDCVAQLTTVLSIAHFTQAAQVMSAREELRVAEWQQQNEADRARDLQQLEGLVVEAVGGVQALQQQLAEQRVVLDGQVVGLEHVAEWLQRMQAGSALIVGHLQQLSSQVDGIREGVAGVHLDVTAVRDQMEQLVAVLLPPKRGQLRPQRVPMDSLPDLALPRERIQVARDLAGALADAQRGAFGGVMQALWAGHQVAVKVYNITGLGMRDCRDAVHEAVMLCKANHPNIVRCYGVVYDPDAAAQDSIQGSLVMEWVEGGSLYDWLQDAEQDELRLEGRVLLALRVAEGMRHLGEKRLVHGDLKPQNVLVTSVGATAGVPQVKICDFGLATYSSTTLHSTRTPAQAAAYTLAYTSPERLADYRRTPQDDVYAFGILLYFIATGRTPFRAIPAALLKQAIVDGTRPDIDHWLEGQVAASGAEREAAEAYCRLAKRCWAAEAGVRPTFEAVLGELSGMLGRLRGQQ